VLRLLDALPAPETPAPRVIGVDEYAMRKGRVWGPVLSVTVGGAVWSCPSARGYFDPAKHETARAVSCGGDLNSECEVSCWMLPTRPFYLTLFSLPSLG
jgi:hypothetical protein